MEIIRMRIYCLFFCVERFEIFQFWYIIFSISDVIAQIYDGVNWTRPAWDSVFKSKIISRMRNHRSKKSKIWSFDEEHSCCSEKQSSSIFYSIYQVRTSYHQSNIFSENIKYPSVMISFKIAWLILHGYWLDWSVVFHNVYYPWLSQLYIWLWVGNW